MIKYIIVDDEVAAHEIIAEYTKELPQLHFMKSCYNALEAMTYLNNHKVDLIFLDINMPKLTGFEFLKTLKTYPKIIVTSAYSEYALEGYDLNISDYLLKPFSFQRFLSAIQKVSETIPSVINKREEATIEKKISHIFLKDDKKHIQVKVLDILFLEAYGNYVKVHLDDRTIITYQTLSSFTEMLPIDQFIRVHKSFIIAIPKITLIEGNRVTIGGHKIPIGQTYKSTVSKLYHS